MLKVVAFIFVFVWLRGTLPRLRYDQFMALGWKVLIPVSLLWVMIVATVRTLRTEGYHAWAVALIVASTVAAIALLLLMRNKSRAKVGPAASQVYSDYPVPPLPSEKERADA